MPVSELFSSVRLNQLFHQRHISPLNISDGFIKLASQTPLSPWIISRPLRFIAWPLEEPDPLVGNHWTKLAVYNVVQTSSSLSCYSSKILLTHWCISINKLILSDRITHQPQGTLFCRMRTITFDICRVILLIIHLNLYVMDLNTSTTVKDSLFCFSSGSATALLILVFYNL